MVQAVLLVVVQVLLAARKKLTKSGNARQRKTVKLDLTGIKNFAGTFGKNGQTFNAGLFSKVEATKGALLEDGDPSNNQVPRPWLSAITFKGTDFHKDLMKILANYARSAFAGQDLRKETAIKIEGRIKDFVADQEFVTAGKEAVPKLTDYTIYRKDLAKENGTGSRIYSADTIGIDSGDMIRAIQVKAIGGKRKVKEK